MKTLLQREFPDYPVASLPAIPTHWEDTSWHNDASPSFTVRSDRKVYLQVYIDYEDEALRECGGARFAVMMIDQAQGVIDYDMLTTDDWSAVLALVANWERGQ